MKVYKILFVAYLLALLWLLLFKTSLDLPSVFAVHIQKINIIPFAGFSQDFRGMIDNVIVFIPLGLLLGLVFKQNSFYQKLAFVVSLSIAVETLQFIFSIGVTDITDVITNVSGGIIGLVVYNFGTKHGDSKTFDRAIASLCACLLVVALFLRFFVFRVRY